MKKIWKAILGVIFLIGGLGCIGSDMGVAAFGIFVGIALIVWWIVGRRNTTSNSSTVEKTSQPSLLVAQVASQSSHPSATSKEGFDFVIPGKKDGAPLAYKYSIPFTPSNPGALLSAAKEKQWYLSAKQVGQEIHLFSAETDLGVLTERADMVYDWIRRSEPYLIILERVNSETECTVMLVFYRDKQKYYANREQTVIALTAFKSEAKQDALSCLGESDELDLEEDGDKEDSVVVTFMGDAIGRLPKKYAQKYISDGAALVVLDHTEEDDEFMQKPYVRIYW